MDQYAGTEFAAPAGMEAGEEPMHAWCVQYVQQQREYKAAEVGRGNRNYRPDRGAVRAAVAAEMRNQGFGGLFFWIRVAFWVIWIMSLL